MTRPPDETEPLRKAARSSIVDGPDAAGNDTARYPSHDVARCVTCWHWRVDVVDPGAPAYDPARRRFDYDAAVGR